MMENAGNALARQLLLGLRGNVRGKKVAIVCGLSNNGGAGELSK
jgi:NAD(P)H-hydrate repair Nnr-like enzyme with NAD(P)H-hydrate epimerase domain